MSDNRVLRERYKRDPLFCQWLPVLSQLAREGGRRPEEVWHVAQVAIGRLAGEEEAMRVVELEYIYTDLCVKYRNERMFTVAVMAVLQTCLADSAPEGRVRDNPHYSVCVALPGMMRDEPLFLSLLERFGHKKRDPFGEKIVLPLTDYVALGGEVEEEEENGLSPDEVVELRQVVDEAIATHDPDTCSSLLPVVSSLNAKTGHSCQSEVDRLTREIYRLRAERNQPRRVENRGTYIETNQGPVNGDVKEQKILLPNDYESYGTNRCLEK